MKKSNHYPIIPDPKEDWVLQNKGVKKAGDLIYKNIHTGEVINVINMPYNQPVEVLVERLEFSLKRVDENRELLKTSKEPEYVTNLQKIQYDDLEQRIKDKIVEYKRTGKAY